MRKSNMPDIKIAICPECGKKFPVGRVPINKEKLILAEDRDIQGFMFQACKAFAKSNEIQLFCFNSASELGTFIKSLATMENFSPVKTIVVARDADANVQSSIQSIKSALERVTNVNLPIPQEPFRFVSNDNIKTAFVLFPGPDEKGEYQTGSIEDLCLALVNDDPLLKSCVAPFIECAQANQEKGETLKYQSKSEFYAYLAGKHHHAGIRLGMAAGCKLWNWDDDRIAPFKAIIEQM